MLTAKSVSAETLYVGTGKAYANIQNAVDSAGKDDVIIVERGEYDGDILINKPLTLIGNGYPTINGLSKGSGITVNAPHVKIKGFKIINDGDDLGRMDAGILLRQKAKFAVIENNRIIKSNSNGIYVDGAFFATVKDNFITSSRGMSSENQGYGIYLWNAGYGVFKKNRIKYFVGGFYVISSPNSYILKNIITHVYYGAHYMFSYHGIIAGNFVKDTVDGLALMDSRYILAALNTVVNAKHEGFLFTNAFYNKIINNVVIRCNKGMDLYDAVYNKIVRNLVINNKIGMHVWGGSFPNTVYDNSFINNVFQIKFLAHNDVYWDYNKKGNYWSDYNGFSMKKNNVGSLPYRSNSISSYIYWKFPIAKLLLSGSPVIQTLQFIENSFPIFTIPGIVDKFPYLKPTFPKKIIKNSTKKDFSYVKIKIGR